MDSGAQIESPSAPEMASETTGQGVRGEQAPTALAGPRYPPAMMTGPRSQMLAQRLTKGGQKYFDSGDYNMEQKQKKTTPQTQPTVPEGMSTQSEGQSESGEPATTPSTHVPGHAPQASGPPTGQAFRRVTGTPRGPSSLAIGGQGSSGNTRPSPLAATSPSPGAKAVSPLAAVAPPPPKAEGTSSPVASSPPAEGEHAAARAGIPTHEVIMQKKGALALNTSAAGVLRPGSSIGTTLLASPSTAHPPALAFPSQPSSAAPAPSGSESLPSEQAKEGQGEAPLKENCNAQA